MISIPTNVNDQLLYDMSVNPAEGIPDPVYPPEESEETTTPEVKKPPKKTETIVTPQITPEQKALGEGPRWGTAALADSGTFRSRSRIAVSDGGSVEKDCSKVSRGQILSGSRSSGDLRAY